MVNRPIASTKQRVRMVVADPHQLAREGLCRLIEDVPDFIVVGKAGNSEAALDLTLRLKPHMLLSEACLPGCGIINIAGLLECHAFSTQIIVLSSKVDRSFLSQEMPANVAGYLLKKEPLSLLEAAIRGIARGEKGWFSREVVRQMQFQQARHRGTRLSEREREVLFLLAEGLNN